MIVLDTIQQGSDEWFAEKLGKPSASNASKIITNDGKPSKQRDGYLYELAYERISGQREECYKNAAMDMGKEREEESRKLFELTQDVELRQVGVIYKDNFRRFLCSPDGVYKQEYGVELKNPLGKTQVKYLLDSELPSEYFGQVQFSLYVTGFKYWMFQSYAPGLNPLLIKVEPDKKYIQALEVELEMFCKSLDEITKKIKEI